MREHGFETDGWPELFERVLVADILILGTPIWLGEKSSVCTRVIERLYGNSAQLNERGQSAYYGLVGGCIITRHAAAAKPCAINVLSSLQHPRSPLPPPADPARPAHVGPRPPSPDHASGAPARQPLASRTRVAARVHPPA